MSTFQENNDFLLSIYSWITHFDPAIAWTCVLFGKDWLWPWRKIPGVSFPISNSTTTNWLTGRMMRTSKGRSPRAKLVSAIRRLLVPRGEMESHLHDGFIFSCSRLSFWTRWFAFQPSPCMPTELGRSPVSLRKQLLNEIIRVFA